MPSWSDGEGGGRVHEQLAELVGENRLFFACAGNTAERHWAGPFQEGGDGYHAWRTGRTDNRLSPWGKDRVSVELCAPAGSVYELSVCERDTAREIGRCLAQSGQGKACAVVHVEPRDGRVYVVRVRHRAGVPSPFHVVALGAGLEEAVARGSIPFPADGPAVVAVGAVNEGGLRQLYSSCGPNSRRPKPDLVAPVPFPSSVRARPFGGTSAAAPQAAALAALWWSRHPEWSANQVRTTLTDTARDLGPRGHDFETGYGMIGLPWQRLAALEEKLGTR
jgi:subtilisin family serine protease